MSKISLLCAVEWYLIKIDVTLVSGCPASCPDRFLFSSVPSYYIKLPGGFSNIYFPSGCPPVWPTGGSAIVQDC